MNDTILIYVWPDNTWISEEDIDDMDQYLCATKKSDDYTTYELDINLDAEDIQELIDLKALPGMLPPLNQCPVGPIAIPKDSIIIITHSKDIDYSAVTMLEDKLIVNAPKMTLEIIAPKKNTNTKLD